MLHIFSFVSLNSQGNDFSLDPCKSSQMSFSLSSDFFQFSGSHIDSYGEFCLMSCFDSSSELKQNTADWKTFSL
jgi:hypothetical protein